MASVTRRGMYWRAMIRRGGLYASKTFDTQQEARKWADVEEGKMLESPDYKPPKAPKPVWYDKLGFVVQRDRDHLYIMQNSRGDIKIGRSFDVDKRRRAFQGASGMLVTVVNVLKYRGMMEASVHALVAEHRTVGEWFRDCPSLRNALAAKLTACPSEKFLALWKDAA